MSIVIPSHPDLISSHLLCSSVLDCERAFTVATVLYSSMSLFLRADTYTKLLLSIVVTRFAAREIVVESVENF